MYNTPYARRQYYLHAEGTDLRGRHRPARLYWGSVPWLTTARRWPFSGLRPSRPSGEGWATYERESHHHGHAGVAQDLPLIAEEQSENGAAFRISGLSPEPVAEFSIEDSPTDPVTAVFFSGRNLAKSYIFVSRRDYSEAQSVRSQTAAFLSS